MSSLTATLVTGELHRYDRDIIPYHLIEIYEGDAITMVIRPFDETKPVRRWMQVAPGQLRDAVFAAMALVLPEFKQHPLASVENLYIDKVEPTQIRDLAAFTAAQWSFAVDATLRDSCYLKVSDFELLEAADVAVFTPSYVRQNITAAVDEVDFDN